MTRRSRAPQRAVEPEQLPLFGRPASPAPRARYASADIAPSRVFAPPGMVDAEVDAGAVRAWRESVADVVGAIRAARSIGEAERARVAGYEWGEDAAAFVGALAASLDGALTPRGPVNVAPLRAASKRLLAVLAWPITPAREAPEARRWARFEAERGDIAATITDASAAVWRAAVRALGAVGGRAFVWVPRVVAHEVARWPVVVVGEPGDAREALSRLAPALRRVRERYASLLPEVGARPPTVELRYDRAVGRTYALAHYSERRGAVVILARHPDMETLGSADMARIVAHEVGHHVWQRLPVAAGERWRAWRAREVTTIDPAALRQAWRHVGPRLSIGEAARRIADADPVLALQVEGALYAGHLGRLYTTSESPDRELSAPTSREPISARAALDDEEAFVEALALLVAYGPGAVSPGTRAALASALPQLRGAKANDARRGLNRRRVL